MQPRSRSPPSPPAKNAPAKGSPQRGGGGDDPLVTTEARGPYFKGVEVGTVRSVHRKRGGVVCMGYPHETTL